MARANKRLGANTLDAHYHMSFDGEVRIYCGLLHPPIIFELAPSESLDLHCGNKIAIQSRAAADPA
jgi:hypothetical protein